MVAFGDLSFAGDRTMSPTAAVKLNRNDRKKLFTYPQSWVFGAEGAELILHFSGFWCRKFGHFSAFLKKIRLFWPILANF